MCTPLLRFHQKCLATLLLSAHAQFELEVQWRNVHTDFDRQVGSHFSSPELSTWGYVQPLICCKTEPAYLMHFLGKLPFLQDPCKQITIL